MARKVNVLKLAQESRGQAAVTNRQPITELAALYLLQMRLPKLKIPSPKKRLLVAVDAETRAQIERFVKITHVA